MAILLETQHSIATRCHHHLFCGTISKGGVLWDVYTMGFCSVATNGKEKVVLDDAQLETFVAESEVIAWVVDGNDVWFAKPRPRRWELVEFELWKLTRAIVHTATAPIPGPDTRQELESLPPS